MSEEKKASPPPNVPNIKRCPYCGHPVLIGDVDCSNCGRRVETIDETFRKMDPNFLAGLGIALGIMVSIAAIEASDFMRLVLLIVGAGLVLSGSLYMGINIVFLDNKRRRK